MMVLKKKFQASEKSEKFNDGANFNFSSLRFILFFCFILIALNIVSAAPVNDTFHLNLQTTYSNGSIETGTFVFAFNITESSDASCLNPVYNYSIAKATDSAGIVSIYLPAVGDTGNLSQLNFDRQYYLCYYRDGSLKDVSQLGRVPYSFRATQINLSEITINSNLNLSSFNISQANGGFFSFLGSLTNRITTLFVQSINASSNINTSGIFFGNGSGLTNVNASSLNNLPYTAFMPFNTSVAGNFSFNGGWENNGLSIIGGDIYAQTGYFYNITSLNVTQQNLTINNALRVFGNAQLDQNLTVDTSTLFVDSNSNSVGFGTTNPLSALHVSRTGAFGGILVERTDGKFMAIGAGLNAPVINWDDTAVLTFNVQSQANKGTSSGQTELMRITSTGNVGIGTTTPAGKLHLNGSAVNDDILIISNNDTTAGASVPIFLTSKSGGGLTNVNIENGGPGHFVIRTGATTESDYGSIRVLVNVTGHTGINTTNPQNTLNVFGDINTTGNLTFYDEIKPDGDTCAAGQILKKTAANNWDCAADDSTAGGTITGLGTVGRVPLWNGTSALNNSNIYQTTGGRIGINISTPTAFLETRAPFILGTQTGSLSYEGVGGLIVNLTSITGPDYITYTFNNGNVGVGTGNVTSGIGYSSVSRILTLTGDGSSSVSSHGLITLVNNRPTAAAGDALGQIDFLSLNNTGPRQMVRILSHLEGSGGTNGYGAYIKFDIKGDNASSVTERMRIDSSGNVGIGTTSPSANLHINSSSTPGVYITQSAVGAGVPNLWFANNFSGTPNYGGVGLFTDNSLRFSMTGSFTTPAVTIQNVTGNLGINTTTPTSTLHVHGNGYFNKTNFNVVTINSATSDSYVQLAASGTTKWYIRNDFDDSHKFQILNDTSDVTIPALTITQGNSFGINTTSPVGAFEAVGNDIYFSESTINATRKHPLIKSRHYDTGEEPVAMFTVDSQSYSTSPMYIGGGLTSTWNAVTSINFFTAANSTTTTGIPRMIIDGSGLVGIGTTSPNTTLNVHVASGRNPAFSMSDGDVSHGVVNYASNDTIFKIATWGSTSGGAYLQGFTDTNDTSVGFFAQGVLGGTNDTVDTTPAILLAGGKANSGNIQALGSSETVLQIGNGVDGATKLVTVLGNGNVGIGTTTPQNTLNVFGDINTTGNFSFYGEIMPDGDTCASGQILKKTGTNNWDCAADDSTAGGTITGLGTVGRVPLWNGTSALNNSNIYQGTGGSIGIGIATPNSAGVSRALTLVSDGDGAIYELGYSGGTRGAYLFSNSANTVLSSVQNLPLHLNTNDTNRLTILSSGNVGIGTTNPALKLHINGSGSAASAIRFENTEVSTTWDMFSFTGGHFLVRSNNNTDFRISNSADGYKFSVNTSSGNVGIGTTTPSALLHLNSSSGISIRLSDGSETWQVDNGQASAGLFSITETGADRRLVIQNNTGNVGIGTTNPQNTLNVIGNTNVTGNITLGTGLSERIRAGATLSYIELYNTNSGDMTFNSTFATGDINFYTSGSSTPNLIINASGNVGIGATAPVRLLHLNTSSVNANTMQITNADTGSTTGDGLEIGLSSAEQGLLWNYENAAWRIATNNADRLYIGADGLVGIGTTAPVVPFHVNTSIAGACVGYYCSLAAGPGRLTLSGNRSELDLQDRASTSWSTTDRMVLYYDSDIFRFHNGTDDVMVIDRPTGEVGIGTSNPLGKFNVNGTSSTELIASITNTGSGNSVLYLDAADGDLSGSDYGWIMQQNDLDIEIGSASSANANLLLMPDNGVGNVGIGTTGPATKLSVTAGAITVGHGDNDNATLSGGSGFGALLRLRSGSAVETVRWDGGGGGGTNWVTSGNVGIGTTGPADALSVIGNVNASGCFELANGTVVGGSCVSDRNTKENIDEYSADMSKLLALSPKQFEFKGEMTNVNGSSKKIFTHMGKNGKLLEMEMPQGIQTGFIADEVEQFYPEWVSEDENGLKRVTYGMNWIFELWQQNQQQQKENEALKRCILTQSTLAEIQACVAAT